MREQGKTIEVSGSLAKVELPMSEACRRCEKCVMGPPGKMITEADNPLVAKVGDRVEIEIPSPRVVGASMIIFVLPLVGLIVGYFAGAWVFPRQVGVGIWAGVGLMIAIYIPIMLYDRLAQEKYRCKIVRVIKGE